MKVDIEFIRRQLLKRAGQRQLAKVSRLTEVPLSTLRRIINGESCTIKNAQKLQPFLEQNVKVNKLVEGE